MGSSWDDPKLCLELWEGNNSKGRTKYSQYELFRIRDHNLKAERYNTQRVQAENFS